MRAYTNARALSLCRVAAATFAFSLLVAFSQTTRTQIAKDVPTPVRASGDERTRYRINVEINLDERTYTATQRLRWTNTDDRPTPALYFNLYPNLRSDAAAEATGKDTNKDYVADEPGLEIIEARLVREGRDSDGVALPFTLEERGASLRVNLRTAIVKGARAEVEIKFRGRVPEIDADETGLLAHVVQGVDAALRDAREVHRARDFNFHSRGVMLLGAWYPVLAVRAENGDWQRKTELNIGRLLFAEPADYEVNVMLPQTPNSARYPDAFTSGALMKSHDITPGGLNSARHLTFGGEALRDFALVIGRNLRASEEMVEGVRMRSVYLPEQERAGRRVLDAAREAVALYTRRFGRLPFKEITIVGAPLVAGRGSLEFSGMSVVASAFYIDFDSPAARNLPEIVREQRASLEDSLEWTIAHGVAHQWWGAGAVGNDPKRFPVLDEGLAQWAALLHYRARHGEERGAQALEDQLRGVYAVYRTFGGDDREADRPAGDYRNSFQYAAIISGKGALLLEALRKQLGDERTNAAVRDYYTMHLLKIAETEDLRASFARQATTAEERRAVTRTFNRWLGERRGDEDIAPPNPQLADAIGISQIAGTGSVEEGRKEGASANPLRPNTYVRIGRFFWKQMTRIR